MVLDNTNAIDWAMFTDPGEEWTTEDVNNYYDVAKIKAIYAYPVLDENPDINSIMDKLNKAFETHKPLNIPGVFKL